MALPFLAVFPREIRDLIYRFVLADSNGSVTLSPWTVEVAQSLTLLRTCRQIHEECKAIIWHDNGLSIRNPTQLSQILRSQPERVHVQHLRISLEMLDSGELAWAASAMEVLRHWPSLKTITISTAWEKPRGVEEFREQLALRKLGQNVDGRRYMSSMNGKIMLINTGWPPFTHWGKQKWLREMLMDSSRTNELLSQMHRSFGGELWVDNVVCFRQNAALNNFDFDFDPRNGEIRLVSG